MSVAAAAARPSRVDVKDDVARARATQPAASRLAEAFPLIAAAALAVVGVVLFVAVLWPAAEQNGDRDGRIASAPTGAPSRAPEPQRSTLDPAPSAPAATAEAPAPTPADPSPPATAAVPDVAPSAAAAIASKPPASPLESMQPEVAEAPQLSAVEAMVRAAVEGDNAELQRLARELASQRPPRGDRVRARQFNAQGLALMNTARYAEAVPAFEAAYRADRADAEVRENLGYALLKAGRTEEAERALLSALEIGPRRASAWGSLGYVYAKRGRESEAVQLILTAYRFAPNRRKALDTYTRQAATDPDPTVRAMLTAAVERLRAARR